MSNDKLETDEPRSDSLLDRLRRDQDLRLAAGCVLFAVVCVVQGVAVIAIGALQDPRSTAGLIGITWQISALTALLGIVAVAFDSIAGFFGSVSGVLCGCIFLFLRLRENSLGYEGVKGLEPAQYDLAIASWLPVVIWLGHVVVLIVVIAIKEKVLSRRRLDRGRTSRR